LTVSRRGKRAAKLAKKESKSLINDSLAQLQCRAKALVVVVPSLKNDMVTKFVAPLGKPGMRVAVYVPPRALPGGGGDEGGSSPLLPSAKALALAIKQSYGALTDVSLSTSLLEALDDDVTAEERAMMDDKDLLAYWRSLAPSVTETSTTATGESVSVTKAPVMAYRSKLIICGYGGVGKTSLLNAL
jgi:hypothetical protein